MLASANPFCFDPRHENPAHRADANTPWFGNWRSRRASPNFGARRATPASPRNVGANGSPVQCADIAADNLPALLAFAAEKRPDLTVVGPDNPLALGMVDLFQQHGLRIWGPNREAAQFESSKAFSQAFMEKHGIPTAHVADFLEAAAAAKEFAAALDGRCAVKADGLALGKGVLHLPLTMAEAARRSTTCWSGKNLARRAAQIVIQELLEGMEISLHALCDGEDGRALSHRAGPQTARRQ